MLNSVAEFYEEDVQNALGAAMALIEPVILIVMACGRGRSTDLAVSADLQSGIGDSLNMDWPLDRELARQS